MADGPPINMFLKADTQNGQFDWDLGQNNPPPHGKAPVQVPRGKSHDIVIHLVGSPGIAFDTNDPVWVQKGGNCPPAPGNSCKDQIDDVQCTPNKLTMHDTNLDRVNLIYQMNFIGAPPCDPEIRNGGR